jgi:hypothetical protein
MILDPSHNLQVMIAEVFRKKAGPHADKPPDQVEGGEYRGEGRGRDY